jgi:hypothetical protein
MKLSLSTCPSAFYFESIVRDLVLYVYHPPFTNASIGRVPIPFALICLVPILSADARRRMHATVIHTGHSACRLC